MKSTVDCDKQVDIEIRQGDIACLFSIFFFMKELFLIKDQIELWLEKNRDLLSVDDVLILEDCLDLIRLIESTRDVDLKKIHLLDLVVKFNVFFLSSSKSSL